MSMVNIRSEIRRLNREIEATDNPTRKAALKAERDRLQDFLSSTPSLESKKSTNSTLSSMLSRYRDQLGVTQTQTHSSTVSDSSSEPESIPCPKKKNKSSYRELASLLRGYKEQREIIADLDDKLDKVMDKCLPESESQVNTASSCPADYKQVLMSENDKQMILSIYHKLKDMKDDLERQI